MKSFIDFRLVLQMSHLNSRPGAGDVAERRVRRVARSLGFAAAHLRHLVAAGVSAIQGSGRAAAVPVPSLVQLYPNLWTWWIPETLVGAIPALVLAAAGI